VYEYRQVKLHVRITLASDRDEEFMGPGLLRLLRGIEETRSIAQAARAMDLSYVKALRILTRLERHIGRELVRRSKGGAERGGAELTPAGRRLVRDFQNLHDTITNHAGRRFDRFARKQRKPR